MTSNLTVLDSCQCCGSAELVSLNVMEEGRDRFAEAIGIGKQIGWQLCCRCSVIFQNPRASVDSQEDFYSTSGYRKVGSEQLVTQAAVDFAPHQLARFHHWLLMNNVNMGEVQNSNILDFGCGIGGALSFFADKGNNNFGVEIDRHFLEFGNKHYPITIVPTLQDLSADTMFKIIFSNHALEHIFDPNELIEFASKRLTDSGVLMIAIPTWRYCSNMNGYSWFRSTENSLFDHVSLATLLNKHGMYLTSFLYQEYGDGGDWELFVTAIRSPKKNHYSFSVDEVLKEVNVNMAAREDETASFGNTAGSHIAAKNQPIHL